MWIIRKRALVFKVIATVVVAGVFAQFAAPYIRGHAPGYGPDGGSDARRESPDFDMDDTPPGKVDFPEVGPAPPPPSKVPAAPARNPAAPAPRLAVPDQRKETAAPPLAPILRESADESALVSLEQQHTPFRNDHCSADSTPWRRIVYVKTHKTGSSTLANIFHRFAYRHKVLPVLPKGNLFLGWPMSKGIPKSFVPLPQAQGKYEIFCSAHTRYSRPLIEAIVPDARYVTIVREPASHFKSSWSYWGTAGHIMKNTGMTATMEEFLKDPDVWWPRANKGDRDLLNNNVAFDMGYTKDITKQQAQELLDHLKTFSLVMVTEYMDESLVLLKRLFCWELIDVIYYGLKVTKKKKAPMAEWMVKKIKSLNWVDDMIYQHFNKTLHERIAKEKDFYEEVAEFRRMKQQLSEGCKQWSWWSEDQHRAALLGDNGQIDKHEKHCHLAQLDSGGFVKFLKNEWGVPDPECMTQGQPRKQVVYIKTHKTGSSTLTNIFHRFVVKMKLRPLLPKNNLFLGWPNKGNLMDSYVKLPPKQGKDIYDVLCSAHSMYNPAVTNKLIPGAQYVTILRNPVSHFISSWNYWHVSDHFTARLGRAVTMEEFLADTDKYTPKLTDSDSHLVHNSMSFDLGIGNTPTQASLSSLIMTLQGFSMVLITEHMDESLVMMRRTLCWKMEDIVHLSLKVAKGSSKRPPVDSDLAVKIKQYNYADTALYKALNNTLWIKIKKEIGFAKELEEFRQLKALWQAKCQPMLAIGEDAHRKALQEEDHHGPLDETARQCHSMLLDSSGYVKLLKYKRGRKDLECHTQGRPRTNIQFVKTHKTGSSTLTNIFHRFGVEKRLKFALPKDNLFYGWPNEGASAVPDSIDRQIRGPYNLLVSAHSMYHRKEFNELVSDPMTQRITVLRDPIKHFVSSWLHWHVGDHIKANGGPELTMDQFLDSPDEHLKKATWSDPLLIRNGVAFDLGLGQHPKRPAVEAMIQTLRTQFSIVLITDHMDESLVLMRRILCWPMEYIVHVSLKVSHEAKKAPTVSAATQAKIRKMNWADAAMYDAMNKTLWWRIDKEIGFQEELAVMRKEREKATQQCQHLIWKDEDYHRKALEEDQALTPAMRKCHYMLLDSKGFVKHIKKISGGRQRECRTAAMVPVKTVALVEPRFALADTVSNVVHRYAYRHQLADVIPADINAADWSTVKLKVSVLHGGPRVPRIMASGSLPFDKGQFERRLSGAQYFGVVSDPVSHFMNAWTKLKVATRLAKPDGSPLTVKEFLLDTTASLAKLGDDAKWLANGMAYSYGVKADDQTAARSAVQSKLNEFRLVLVSEQMVESLIMMRRLLCWELDDIAIMSATETPAYDASEMTPEVNRGIKAFNWLDSMLYERAEQRLSEQLAQEVALASEVGDIKALMQKTAGECSPLVVQPQSAHVSALNQKDAQSKCRLTLLDREFFHTFLMRGAVDLP